MNYKTPLEIRIKELEEQLAILKKKVLLSGVLALFPSMILSSDLNLENFEAIPRGLLRLMIWLAGY